MIRWLLRICVGVATGVPALAFALAGLWAGAVGALLLGISWLALDGLRWRWLSSTGLILCTGLAGIGITLGLPAMGMLVSLLAALTAWDLDDLRQALESDASLQRAAAMQRQHLQRLLTVDVLGLVLGLVALQVRTRLTLGLALLLGLLAILGLSRAIAFLRRESD